MCKAQFVLVFVAWYVGAAHSWDFAVSLGDQLIFITSDGTKTDTVLFESHNVTAITYDEVHNRMLYVNKQSDNDTICGYYISSKENKCFLKSFGRNIRSIAYDPATEKIFFTETNKKNINWISLKPGIDTNVDDLIETDNQIPSDIAIDSCRGYIYWCYGRNIKRVRLNSSVRENLHNPYNQEWMVYNLAIDTQTQKIYYIDGSSRRSDFNYADLNRHNSHHPEDNINTERKEMTVSKDYIYWSSSNGRAVWQYLKNLGSDKQPKEIIKFSDSILGLTAYYKIDDQIKGIHDCDALSSLLPITEAPATTQRSDVSVCDNYCLQGSCSVNDEGHPKCSCNAGYTGPRCQVDVCLGYCSNNGDCSLNKNHEPVCQCKGDYLGHRCEISDCLNYCMHGNCSLSDEGHPKCSCNAGYTGPRCQVDVCLGYCSNNGDCSLNKNHEPVCQCKGDYLGHRCEISDCLNYCMHGNCSLSDEGHPKCSCDAAYLGERCEVSACHGYCLNDGECSLNEEDEPICQCVGNHEGSRCEADINGTTATYELTKINPTLADLLFAWRNTSSNIYLTVNINSSVTGQNMQNFMVPQNYGAQTPVSAGGH